MNQPNQVNILQNQSFKVKKKLIVLSLNTRTSEKRKKKTQTVSERSSTLTSHISWPKPKRLTAWLAGHSHGLVHCTDTGTCKSIYKYRIAEYYSILTLEHRLRGWFSSNPVTGLLLLDNCKCSKRRQHCKHS